MTRRWIIVGTIIGVLVLGITGGAVLAQGGGTDGDATLKGLPSRVAAILGLDEAQVQDAFKQAAREMQDERLQRKLDHLVELGKLTQEEADDYKAWYLARPEGPLHGKAFSGLKHHKLKGRFGH